MDEYVTGVTGCEILDSGCWKKLPRDKEGKEGNKLYLDLFEQLKVLGEKEVGGTFHTLSPDKINISYR